jgi:serine/threonine protein kinase
VCLNRLGTIDYLSPEILDCPVKQHPQDHKVNPQKWYTCKVDVWSIGVLAYELLLGRTPFEAVRTAPALHLGTRLHSQPHTRLPVRTTCTRAHTLFALFSVACVLTVSFLFFPAACRCLQRTPQETLYKIKTQEVAYTAELSEGATAFIQAALVRDPERRASLTDLLQHPWLLKHLRSSTGPAHMRGRTHTQVCWLWRAHAERNTQ